MRRLPDRWSIAFVPPNGRGDEAEFFARAFSRCIALHEPGVEVRITSEPFADLR